MGERFHTVLETAEFRRAAARLLSEADLGELIAYLARNPQAGDVIPGSGGARKVRCKRPGQGKSGGVRVITFYSGVDLPLFLLNVFGKNTKVDLSAAERNELRNTLASVAAAYRNRR
jgi:hypothetical protein